MDKISNVPLCDRGRAFHVFRCFADEFGLFPGRASLQHAAQGAAASADSGLRRKAAGGSRPPAAQSGARGGLYRPRAPARVPCEGIPEALLLGRCSCAALAEIFVDSGSEKAENTLSWSLHSDSVRRPPEDPARVTTQGHLRLFWSACLALGTHAAFPAPPSERVPL